MLCRKCTKQIPTDATPVHEYNACDDCPFVLCRFCDDTTSLLRVNPENGYIYCRLCATINHDKKKKDVCVYLR